jgi:hypothetical protein
LSEEEVMEEEEKNVGRKSEPPAIFLSALEGIKRLKIIPWYVQNKVQRVQKTVATASFNGHAKEVRAISLLIKYIQTDHLFNIIYRIFSNVIRTQVLAIS